MNSEMGQTFERIRGVFRQVLVDVSNVLPYRYFSTQRQWILSWAGVKFSGKACVFGRQTISYPTKLEVGAGTFINCGSTFENEAVIILGSHCHIGPGCLFATTNHIEEKRLMMASEIVIGDDVWIGAGCIILPGVTIGHGSTIAAGAVVTKNVAAKSRVAGVPARQMS